MPLHTTAGGSPPPLIDASAVEHGAGVVELDLPAGVGAGELLADERLD